MTIPTIQELDARADALHDSMVNEYLSRHGYIRLPTNSEDAGLALRKMFTSDESNQFLNCLSELKHNEGEIQGGETSTPTEPKAKPKEDDDELLFWFVLDYLAARKESLSRQCPEFLEFQLGNEYHEDAFLRGFNAAA